MTATIHHGDCLGVLRGMPDNSVDAICCDPPYGLSNTSPDKVTETIVRWAQGDREYVPQGKGFMGASWDAFVPPVAVWDECLRVLKPGGHLVAFAGSRTQDLMGLAIRLAGFDIRENLAWLYGSGFPKSHNVGKGIDRKAGATREVVGDYVGPDGKGRGPAHSYGVGGRYRWGDEYHDFADLPPHAQAAVKGSRMQIEGKTRAITAPATPEAARWHGWGTALKPAHEPIILARKPIQGTVAANTLTWGTGGLNIDATRIAHDAKSAAWVEKWSGHEGHPKTEGWGNMGQQFGGSPAGRWPANVVLDPDTAKALDQQSGALKSGARSGVRAPDQSRTTYGTFEGGDSGKTFASDEGGASRFFKVVEPDPPFMYAAKAPKRERPRYTTEDGQTVQHATVKPLSIMQWLVRLVTPEGGTVLDPFAGSGTTVEAAILEGFNVIGIEREEAYLPLIQQRIDRANDVLPMAS